jgi:antitoxin HicB
MRYPVTLSRDDNDTLLVTFPDLPEAITFGATEAEALLRAQDAFATVVDALIKDRRDIPAPSNIEGPGIEIPALMGAKIELYRTMRAKRVGKTELGRRLDWHGPQIDRLLLMRHGSQLDQLEAAFRAMGKRLILVFDEEEAPTLAPARPRVHPAVLASARRARGTARSATAGRSTIHRKRASKKR